jgi:glycosyltransferase involved in cell wall biosynthesis
LPDVVGSAGVLVAPDDPAALAEAISMLADDPQERRRMSGRARAHATAHDWSWAWSNLRRVLDEL